MSRVLSNDSKLFEDTMLTRNYCICRELRENFASEQRDDEHFGLIEDKMGNGPDSSPMATQEVKRQSTSQYDDLGKTTHHPSCPMFKQRLGVNEFGLIAPADDTSVIIKPRLSQKRRH